MEQRRLGASGPLVSAVGYGAMGLEGYYGAADETAAVDTMRHALDRGISFIDTADAYGGGHNERLVGEAVKGRRDHAVIATKFGIVFEKGEEYRELPTGWRFTLRINGSRAYARKALDRSLTALAVDAVDLWYAHYADPSIPIEETVGYMADEVRAGRVKHLGLSNVTAAEVRRAHAVHPIAAVQYEYSLWRREPEEVLLPTLRELGIALVAWSPLGGGFLAGTVSSVPKGDFRHNNPRYSDANLQANADRFAPVTAIARELGITPAQLALAWLLHQGDDVIPIPGSRRKERVDENAAAAAVRLRPEVLARIEAAAPRGLAAGATLLD
jgi:aryl-alcohol dehydrogenase-like predicted oxidoreductase